MRAFTNNTVSPNIQPSFPFLDITALLSIVSKLMKSLNETIKKLYGKNGFVLAAVVARILAKFSEDITSMSCH